MNKAFSDWYDSLPYGEPSYQETFEAGRDSVKYAGELPEPHIAEGEWFPRLRAGTDFYTVKQVRQAIAGALVKASAELCCVAMEYGMTGNIEAVDAANYCARYLEKKAGK